MLERPLPPIPFLFAVATAFLALLGAAILLPHERYYRYQAHDSGTTRKADWIYERLNFDPTPVDVAIIGTSRSAGGLSAERIEAEYCRATGRRIHVANLGIPETGRNMHFAIAKEAARAKRPQLFVVEINETEARKAHNGFVVLADAGDVLSAPVAVNTNFFGDLVRLPGRQLSLFFDSAAGRPAVRPAFDPSAYDGPYFDRTETIKLIDGRVIDKRVERSASDLRPLLEKRLAGEAPLHVLPGLIGGLEYRFSRRYLKAIARLAGAGGGTAIYAYLPAYGAPEAPRPLLAELGLSEIAIDLGGASANDPSLWFDATHWNARGADLASRRFAAALARSRAFLGREAPCIDATAATPGDG